MIRSLYTASSGMKAQQLNIDTISNNLANVNTNSYKAQRVEFKDLMYDTIKRTNLKDEEGRPVNLQVGHGVMPYASKKNFKQGSFIETNNTFDLALDGKGFFVVSLPNGDLRYTRDGSFKLSVDGDESTIVTSDGYKLLNDSDTEIIIEEGVTGINISENGTITGLNSDGEKIELGKIKLVRFMNAEGLLSVGKNLYEQTIASGDATEISENDLDTKVLQGFLEASNVEIVDEMVKMITAQRAYEISSKAITTSDEMMQLTNNLKR